MREVGMEGVYKSELRDMVAGKHATWLVREMLNFTCQLYRKKHV